MGGGRGAGELFHDSTSEFNCLYLVSCTYTHYTDLLKIDYVKSLLTK